MPNYDRKFKKSVRRGRAQRRRYRTKPFASLVKDVGYLKGLINTELKVIDGGATPSTSAAGALQIINPLVQGVDYNNRIGRQVRFKSVQIRGRVSRNAAATQTRDRVRLVLVIDKQPNMALPTWTNLYVNTDPNAFRNLDWRKRFVILWSRLVYTDADDPNRDFRLYRKLNMKTVYDDSNIGSQADITTNALYFGYISEYGTNPPGMDFDWRLRFIDN